MGYEIIEYLEDHGVQPGDIKLAITTPPHDWRPDNPAHYIFRQATLVEYLYRWLDKNGGHLLYHHAPLEGGPQQWFGVTEMCPHQILVWDHTYTPIRRPGYYHQRTSFIYWYTTRFPPTLYNIRQEPNLITNNTHPRDYINGILPPITRRMVSDFLDALTLPGDIVVDPFDWNGTVENICIAKGRVPFTIKAIADEEGEFCVN
jgi:hypothetical protein